MIRRMAIAVAVAVAIAPAPASADAPPRVRSQLFTAAQNLALSVDWIYDVHATADVDTCRRVSRGWRCRIDVRYRHRDQRGTWTSCRGSAIVRPASSRLRFGDCPHAGAEACAEDPDVCARANPRGRRTIT